MHKHIVSALIIALVGIIAYAAHAQSWTPLAVSGNPQSCQPNTPAMIGFDANGIIQCNALGVSQGQWQSTGPTTVASTSDVSVYGGAGNGVGSLTLAANSAYVGETFLFVYGGTYSTPLLNAATITAKVKWGATTLTTATTAGLGIGLTSTNFPFSVSVRCTVQQIGSSGKIACFGNFATTAGLISTSPISTVQITASAVTFDSTQSVTIDSTMAWSSVAAGQTASVIIAGIQRTS